MYNKKRPLTINERFLLGYSQIDLYVELAKKPYYILKIKSAIKLIGNIALFPKCSFPILLSPIAATLTLG